MTVMVIRLSLLFFLVWMLSASAETIRVVGSSTLLPVISEAASRFANTHPGTVITVSGGGSGVGVAAMIRGSADLGMISRSLTPHEARQLQGRVEPIPIARDAVAVMVSKAVFISGVRALSAEQIAAIYRGRIRNWKEVGGLDSPILVIDKEGGRGTRHVFAETILGDARARAPGAVLVAGSNNEMQTLIARSDRAIGILSIAWGNDSVRALALQTSQRSIFPDADNIVAGHYPLQRDLVLLTPRGAVTGLKDFIGFLLSPAGQAIVVENGYLPLR